MPTKRRIDPVRTLFEFTVQGRGDFPFDMLRHDSCWPKLEARDVIRMAPWGRSARLRELREVTLVGLREPTAGRWASFGWKVIA